MQRYKSIFTESQRDLVVEVDPEDVELMKQSLASAGMSPDSYEYDDTQGRIWFEFSSLDRKRLKAAVRIFNSKYPRRKLDPSRDIVDYEAQADAYLTSRGM